MEIEKVYNSMYESYQRMTFFISERVMSHGPLQLCKQLPGTVRWTKSLTLNGATSLERPWNGPTDWTDCRVLRDYRVCCTSAHRTSANTSGG